MTKRYGTCPFCRAQNMAHRGECWCCGLPLPPGFYLTDEQAAVRQIPRDNHRTPGFFGFGKLRTMGR